MDLHEDALEFRDKIILVASDSEWKIIWTAIRQMFLPDPNSSNARGKLNFSL